LKRTILILIAVIATTSLAIRLHAQAGAPLWTNRYNGPVNGYDYATAIAVNTNGTVFVTGYWSYNNFNNVDFATIAYSNSGLPLWTNLFGDSSRSNDLAWAIATDGSIVFVAGESRDINNRSYASTVAYLSSGTPLWTNSYVNLVGARAKAIAVDTNGDALVAGFIGDSYHNFLTIKYSKMGLPLWTNYYAGPGNAANQAVAIAVDGNGNAFVTGTSYTSNEFDYATVAYSSAGNPLWTNRYDGPGNGADEPAAIALDAGGNVFVTGRSMNGIGFTSYDFATIKYSNSGIPLWTNRYDGSGADFAIAIGVDKSGNVYVTGSSAPSSYLTIKYSGAGLPLWTNRYSGTYAAPTALAVDKSDNVIVTGYESNGGPGYDYATFAYSSAGVSLWTNRYNGPANNDDRPSAMAVDGDGNVFVTGSSDGGNFLPDYATIKYSSRVPPPLLAFQRLNSQLVLNWTNVGFNLQTAPAVGGTFTNVPGATSPYTNPINGAQQFFRLKSN